MNMSAKIHSNQLRQKEVKRDDGLRKYSVGLGAGGGKTYLHTVFPVSGSAHSIFTDEHAKKGHTKFISQLSKIDDSKELRQSRDMNLDYPLEDVKNYQPAYGRQGYQIGSAECTTGVNQSPKSQSSNQFIQFQQTNYPAACTNTTQMYQHKSLNESKRSGFGLTTQSGLLTNQRFFQRRSFNGSLTKSQSLAGIMNYNRSKNASRYEYSNNNNNNINQSNNQAPSNGNNISKSINDFLHRNNFALNIQQSMAQMEQITQEVIKQNQQNSLSQQQQQEQLQKLQENQNKEGKNKEQGLSGSERKIPTASGQTDQVYTKQYYVQVQRQLQKAQNDFMNSQRNASSSENNKKKQSHQLNNFVSLDKIQQQYQIASRDNQKFISSQMENISQQAQQYSISKSPPYLQPALDSQPQQQQGSSLSLSQAASNTKLQNQSHHSNRQSEKMVLQKSSNNIFSLTGQKNPSINSKDRLPHQDVLQLCNQSFIDNLNALRKAINREQSQGKQSEQVSEDNQIQQSQGITKQIEGLEGHSIVKSGSKKLLIKQLLQENISKKQNIYLKSEVQEPSNKVDKKLGDKKIISDRIDNSIKRTSKGEIWKGSTHFKVRQNYNKTFTLKQLGGAFDKTSKFNLDGSSTQWQYYLQDTVKQQSGDNPYIQHTEEGLQSIIPSILNGKPSQFKNQQNDSDSSFDSELNLDIPINNQQHKAKKHVQGDDDQGEEFHRSYSSDHSPLPQSEQNSFYKMLKKQNIHLIDNNRGNVTKYEVIDEQFDKIFETRFQKNLAIRKVDMVYNIKHLAILKYKREKKLLEGSQDPQDLLEYIQQKNKIQILLHNAKKIKNLQQVALVIENKINQQNSRINSIVDQLLIKFDINQSQ